MDYQGFIGAVQDVAHIPGDEAERVACATLETLSERMSSGETEDLRERLPDELRPCLVGDHRPDRFHVDEFVRRVARRADVDASSAERDARAVFRALWRAVGADEFADMRAQLPKDFDPLIDDALRDAPWPTVDAPTPPGAMTYDAFLERVAERAGRDLKSAARAADAVLEELAIRISGGQTDDLERRLPAKLRPALERGRKRGRDRAQRISLDAFLSEIARREGVDRGQATEDARAVLTTLREAVGEKEWQDTTAQLPRDYAALWRTG